MSTLLEMLILIGLTPEVDFTNILSAAFTCTDPKSAKNTVKQSVFFVLLGFERLKTLRKMLMKLTPGRSKFLNIHKSTCKSVGKSEYLLSYSFLSDFEANVETICAIEQFLKHYFQE